MDFESILACYAADEPGGRAGLSTMSLTVRAHPPTGTPPAEEEKAHGLVGTAIGTNPFTLTVITNTTTSDSVTFTYGTGSTTFDDADLGDYFTNAPTSVGVTSASPDAILNFNVNSSGTTVYWVTASADGITTAEQSFERSI